MPETSYVSAYTVFKYSSDIAAMNGSIAAVHMCSQAEQRQCCNWWRVVTLSQIKCCHMVKKILAWPSKNILNPTEKLAPYPTDCNWNLSFGLHTNSTSSDRIELVWNPNERIQIHQSVGQRAIFSVGFQMCFDGHTIIYFTIWQDMSRLNVMICCNIASYAGTQ